MARLFPALAWSLIYLWVGIARASTSTTEITDMWWNSSESGWGVNVILQNDVAFLTFFVYDTRRNPIWYVSDAHLQGNSATGPLIWSGLLYATTGPWFGGPFPPSDVTTRQAGTVTFSLTGLNQATLTYTVDGVAVSKSVQRQTWTNENYSGTYLGGSSLSLFACNPASLNGPVESGGTVSINQTGENITLVAAGSADTCTYSGLYAQTGKLGQVTGGTFTCQSGIAGTFTASEMTRNTTGISAKISGAITFQGATCQVAGYFGGIARAR